MSVNLSLPLFTSATKAPPEFAARYWPLAQVLLPGTGISENRNRLAAFCATIAVESNCLQDIEEGLYYKDPVRLAGIFRRVFDVNKNKVVDAPDIAEASKYVRSPSALSKVLYKGFHGRGLIQITWEDNYRDYGIYVGEDLVTNPDRMLEPKHAIGSACWFFKTKGCFAPADKGDMDGVTRIVNPAMMHAAERRAAFFGALRAINQYFA